MTAEVSSQDVVRLMLQYMKENNLLSAMRALQTETGVCMNTVDNLDAFVQDILTGKWDRVLSTVSTLQLPQDKLIAVCTLPYVFKCITLLSIILLTLL